MATDVVLEQSIKKEVKLPPKYKVLFLNDDSTPMEWVIEVLMTIFKHSSESAKKIMLEVHNEGSAIVGVYAYEIAEQKTVDTITASRSNGFPLTVKMEEDV